MLGPDARAVDGEIIGSVSGTAMSGVAVSFSWQERIAPNWSERDPRN